MQIIYEKIQASQQWRKAQERLDNFERIMELIKKYPIKPIKPQPPSPEYRIPEPYRY